MEFFALILVELKSNLEIYHPEKPPPSHNTNDIQYIKLQVTLHKIIADYDNTDQAE